MNYELSKTRLEAACDCKSCQDIERPICFTDDPCGECQGCKEYFEIAKDLQFDGRCACLIITLFLLSGCGKGDSDFSPAIIIAGQSNAQFFEVNGIQPDLQADWGDNPPEIINCGIGGAAIGWLSDNMSKCEARIGARKVIGIIYYQGESDARTCTPNYGNLVVAFMDKFRAEYGEKIPVVIAQLAITEDPASYPCWNEIKTEQSNIQLSLSKTVETDDAAIADGVVDNVHLTPAAERIVGARFIAALKELE